MANNNENEKELIVAPFNKDDIVKIAKDSDEADSYDEVVSLVNEGITKGDITVGGGTKLYRHDLITDYQGRTSFELVTNSSQNLSCRLTSSQDTQISSMFDNLQVCLFNIGRQLGNPPNNSFVKLQYTGGSWTLFYLEITNGNSVTCKSASLRDVNITDTVTEL